MAGYLSFAVQNIDEEGIPVFSMVAYTNLSRLDDYPHLGADGKAAPRGVKRLELRDYVTTHRIIK